MKTKILDIVILSYNVKDQLRDCLNSIYKDPESEKWNIWVVDNDSKDESSQMVKQEFPKVIVIHSPNNVGFSAGNNLVRTRVETQYILFLNPDTIVPSGTITSTLNRLQQDSSIGAITCKVELPNNKLDEGCHRGFPTPWNSFCYFTGLSKLFPKIKLFSGYQLNYQDLNQEHGIDSLTGAFMLLPKTIIDQVGWWDEDYFWNGEDLDLCFRIKKQGFKIWYYPYVRITHYKGSSSGYKKNSLGSQRVNMEVKIIAAKASTQAMRIFYDKHYKSTYPQIVTFLVNKGVDLLENRRVKYLLNNENRN